MCEADSAILGLTASSGGFALLVVFPGDRTYFTPNFRETCQHYMGVRIFRKIRKSK